MLVVFIVVFVFMLVVFMLVVFMLVVFIVVFVFVLVVFGGFTASWHPAVQDDGLTHSAAPALVSTHFVL